MQINSNLDSLTAQRSLARAAASVGGSMARLSSGQRINSARDDAAGLAISQRMTASINGMNRAAQNANDGISMLQVAQGAAGEVTDNFQRIRELAVQAANGTYSNSDRKALQGEVNALMKANYEILGQASFNGHKLLDGHFNESFQLGAAAGQSVQLTLPAVLPINQTELREAEVELRQISTAGGAVSGLLAGNLSLNGTVIGASVDGPGMAQTRNSAYAVALAINAAGPPGLTATGSTTVSGSAGGAGNVGAGALEINGVAIGGFAGANASALAASAAAAISGAGAGVSATASGALGIGNGTGRGIVTVSSAPGVEPGNLVVGGSNPGAAGLAPGTFTPIGTGQFTTVLRAVGSGDPPVDVSSATSASAMLDYVDGKLDIINGLRATLGAAENRMSAAYGNLQTGALNLAAARSRILDTDYASETMELTRGQILQQAGIAMIAQAHSTPSQVLALLR